MKLDELYEDTWLGHQAKRIGTKLGAKHIPKALGGAALGGMAEIRERTSDLMNAWKRMEGFGEQPTLANVNKWLHSGKDRIGKKMTTQASKGVKDPNRKLSNDNLRTYFQRIATAEAKLKGQKAGAAEPEQQQQQPAQTTLDALKKQLATIQAQIDKLG